MHQIPQTLDAQQLVGLTVERVCFVRNNAVLYFGDDLYIQVENSFTVHHSDVKYDIEFIEFDRDFGLVGFLEKTITEVRIENNHRKLVLQFDSGSIIELHSSEQYESFIIKVGPHPIVI